MKTIILLLIITNLCFSVQVGYVKIKFRGNTDNNFYSVSEITAYKDDQPIILSVASTKIYSATNDELISNIDVGNMFDGENREGGLGPATTLNVGDERDSLILEVKFQQVHDMDSIKLGMYDNGGRIFENVEVSISENGVSYATSDPTDIANGNQMFEIFPNSEQAPVMTVSNVSIVNAGTTEMEVGDTSFVSASIISRSNIWGNNSFSSTWTNSDETVLTFEAGENIYIINALKEGTATLTLEAGGLSDSIQFVIKASNSGGTHVLKLENSLSKSKKVYDLKGKKIGIIKNKGIYVNY